MRHIEGYELVFAEDECAPDAERLHAACKRITGSHLESVKRWAREQNGYEDHGDAETFTVLGWKIVDGIPGAREIWRRVSKVAVAASTRPGTFCAWCHDEKKNPTGAWLAEFHQ